MPSEREFEWIERLRKRIESDSRVLVGVGDDAAVLRGSARDWIVTTDMLVEGVHFDLSASTPRRVGWKAMGVNLSDVAAMAGTPVAAFVALGLPPGRDGVAEELWEGVEAAAREFNVVVAGGDTNASPAGLVVAATLLGHPTGRGAVLRSGARPGDAVCVTGRLGYSLAGRHLDFRPRVREAVSLHASSELHAMIDLSDGLARDAFHLARESRCRIVLDEEKIPISRGASTDERTPLDHALNDGEDFELLFSLPAEDAARLIADPPFDDPPVTRIGECAAGEGVFLRTHVGDLRPLTPGGFEHAW